MDVVFFFFKKPRATQIVHKLPSRIRDKESRIRPCLRGHVTVLPNHLAQREFMPFGNFEVNETVRRSNAHHASPEFRINRRVGDHANVN